MIRESQKLGRDVRPPFGSEEGCWFTHVFHLQALKCGTCGAVWDCSSDLDLESIGYVSIAEFGARVMERVDRAIGRARQDGWRLVGYPSEPKFVCPACEEHAGGTR
jgi:hypothetical protein